MTDFSDAIDWSINNIPMAQFDDFRSWWNEVLNNLRGGDKLRNNSTLNNGLEQAWIDEFGSLSESAKTTQEIEDIPEPTREREPIEKPKTIGEQIEFEQRKQPIIIDERRSMAMEQTKVPSTGKAPELPTQKFREEKKQNIFKRFTTSLRRRLRL